MVFDKSYLKIAMLLSVFEGQIHFDRKNTWFSARQRRPQIDKPFQGPFTNTMELWEALGELWEALYIESGRLQGAVDRELGGG